MIKRAQREPKARLRQAAAIPYRLRSKGLEIALITSLRSRRWVFPKGHIEPGEAGYESAVREAHEEAGLLGEVDPRPVGRYRYQKRGELHEVVVYLLRVTRELSSWTEDDVRNRKWMGLRSASSRLRRPDMRELLAGLRQRLSA